MNENLPLLEVHMLGEFSVLYGEQPISFGKNVTTKAMKLLQILMYYGGQGISREKLLNLLYANEELADASNNLRVTSHRLKKILVDAGLPKYEYINIKKGIYSWHVPMPVEIDTGKMISLYKEAFVCKNSEQKKELLENICAMYHGEFLESLSGESWVLSERIRYKEMYSSALKELCRLLMENGEYEETLKFCETACRIYPFDEWQAVRIECYIAMKCYKEALREYEDTARLFFEELGVTPSDGLMKKFEKMSALMNDMSPCDVQNISQSLQEAQEPGGAYYCSLPSFRDSYRLVARMMDRSGQSAYLMVCNLTDGKGHPLEYSEKLTVMAGELKKTIQHCLRRGDFFTKYSASQYLILLTGTNRENCRQIFSRIQKCFTREHASWKKNLEYSVSSVAQVKDEDSLTKFKDSNTVWS